MVDDEAAMVRRKALATRTVGALGVVAVVLAAVWSGTLEPRARWETGTADVVGQVVTIETGEWTYGFEGPLDWTDSDGARSQQGFPTCLVEGAATEVRFAWAPVPDTGTRAVVAVDCRAVS